MIAWDSDLRVRKGARSRLHGITVWHDFDWTDVFSNERTQFRNGKCLAGLVIDKCPAGQEPVLLLTRSQDAREGSRQHEGQFITVVNIDRYLKRASGNAATTYFAMLSSLDPLSAATIDWSSVTAEQFATILDSHLGDDVWNALTKAGADIPIALAHRRLWSVRHEQVVQFRSHLELGDWGETDWQRFFEEKIWIFGYGLQYQFLHLIQTRPHTGGRDVSRTGGQESDFLMSSAAAVRFTVLVEIKTPDVGLVKDKEYRNRTHAPDTELVGGVVQIQQQAWRWAVEGSRTDENRDLLEAQEIYTHQPRGILVIGNLRSLANNRNKMRSFESFRRNLRQPEILTFDELLERSEQMVADATPQADVERGGTEPAIGT